jgi:hypothetical protein
MPPRESVHRIKNLLAVVQALYMKIYREAETTEQYRDLLTDRVRGLEIAGGWNRNKVRARESLCASGRAYKPLKATV